MQNIPGIEALEILVPIWLSALIAYSFFRKKPSVNLKLMV